MGRGASNSGFIYRLCIAHGWAIHYRDENCFIVVMVVVFSSRQGHNVRYIVIRHQTLHHMKDNKSQKCFLCKLNSMVEAITSQELVHIKGV